MFLLYMPENKRVTMKLKSCTVQFWIKSLSIKILVWQHCHHTKSCHFLPNIWNVIRHRVNKTWLFCVFENTLVTTTSIYLSSIPSLYSEYKTLPTHQHQQHKVTCWAKQESTKLFTTCKWWFNIAKPYSTWLPGNYLI